MKIFDNVLDDSLFRDCVDELNEKVEEECWASSTMIWKPSLSQGLSGSCLSTEVSSFLVKKIEKQIKKYLPQYDSLFCQYQIFQPNAGIGFHNDGHKKFGATIYLNEEWDRNAGGWFIWSSPNIERRGLHYALLPEKNLMVLNDTYEDHQVTAVSPLYPHSRYTIQIWGS